MGHDDRREILERLEALERRLDRARRDDDRDGRRGGDHDRPRRRERDREHGRDRDRRGDDFQEKRIIDTIVHLAAEQTSRLIQDQQARARHRDGGARDERCEREERGGRRERGGRERRGERGERDGGGEKRLVDLIVGLVCEHVQEIVASELDRRLGPLLEDEHEHDGECDHDHDHDAHAEDEDADDAGGGSPADDEEQH